MIEVIVQQDKNNREIYNFYLENEYSLWLDSYEIENGFGKMLLTITILPCEAFTKFAAFPFIPGTYVMLDAVPL